MLITRDAVSSLEWTAVVVISLGVGIASLPVRAVIPEARSRHFDRSAQSAD
jgi:hypothetical protein